MNLIEKFKEHWERKPLLLILIIALVPRLVSAIFSQGYAMHDDHFGPIEQPFQIINDISYWENRGEPHGHSIVYPALHYYLFLFLNSIGVTQPQDKMLIVRLLHCFYSLLIVFFGFKIAKEISDEKIAKKIGIILSMLWFLPFMSVHNLVEMVCIPPLMAGSYLIIKTKRTYKNYFLAGVMFAFAFIFRPQTLIFPLSIGIIILFQTQWRECFYLILGLFVTAILTQGLVDWLAWGYPFAAFITYLDVKDIESYATGPVYQYLVLIAGVIIPPISLFLFFGIVRNWKRTFVLFIPVLLFFLFHSFFPNKQERFILPIIPLLIVLGISGWEVFVKQSKFWFKHDQLLKGFWIWFWIINTALLLVFSTTYTKKTRVEPLVYLSDKNATGIVVSCGKLPDIQLPLFYLNKIVPIWTINNENPIDSVYNKIINSDVEPPNYIIFYGIEEIEHRVKEFETQFKKNLTFEEEFHPSLVDDLLYKLNPYGNRNQTAIVFSIK